MSKSRKKQPENEPAPMSEAERRHMLGLYSPCLAPSAGPARVPFWVRFDLSTYIPVGIAIWILIYLLLGLGIMPFMHEALLVLAMLLSGLAFLAALVLFRPAWPPNRTAAMSICLMILDFWVWVWARPFEGAAAKVFLFMDLGLFAAILFFTYMFVFQRLHIEIAVRLLVLKGFLDFAAYVLAGGFEVPILSRFGIVHPLNLNALFVVAMLELWVLLVYALKYRKKILGLI